MDNMRCILPHNVQESMYRLMIAVGELRAEREMTRRIEGMIYKEMIKDNMSDCEKYVKECMEKLLKDLMDAFGIDMA